MRRVRSQWRRVVRKLEIFAIVVFVAGLIVINVVSLLPPDFFLWCGAAAFVGFCFWIATKFRNRNEKYINESGYVVLVRENELEHRCIAKRLLGRVLKQNEIVHHINGKKTDNEVRNLCVMDREKHEFFHSWLSWKRKKSGRYPSFKDQKRVLVGEYGGILLENISPPPGRKRDSA